MENNDPVHSGYILYVDPIGQYMQVDAVKTILWANVRFDLEAGYVPTPESQPDGGVRYTYTGHFATDSGGKTFDSPVYGRGNVDDILVTVNQDADGNQTLRVAVPASAIPIRVNSVTLNVDGDPVNNVSNNAYPLRVCYTVGLKPGVTNADGTLNTDPATGGVSSEYLAQHTDPATNQVYFYSNLYSGNEEDGETVGNATVEFNPASTNLFYFIQENTPLYLDPPVPSGRIRPSLTLTGITIFRTTTMPVRGILSPPASMSSGAGVPTFRIMWPATAADGISWPMPRGLAICRI